MNISSDMRALFRISYGLYIATTNDGKHDNGLIINSVAQVSDSPDRVAVSINKTNYSYTTVLHTSKLNVNCLSVDAPFTVIENFGFHSGRETNKFINVGFSRSDNGLAVPTGNINATISLEAEKCVDLGSHGLFICSVTKAHVLNDRPAMTYTYYQDNVKPKPHTDGVKGFVCKVCGYVYEGKTLPADYICPICKHGASDFEPISK